MNGVKESITPPPPEAPQPIPEAERDHLDTPAAVVAPEPVVEAAPKRTKKQRIVEEPRHDEKFFKGLTERLEHLANPPPIVVETNDNHVAKLLEIEQAMLASITTLTERVEQLSADDARVDLSAMLTMHRDMIVKLSESQAQINVVQTKLIESQAQIVETISLLADKIALFSQTPPVVNPVINVPAPIVNVSTQEGRRTKIVERDHNNLITRITEGCEADWILTLTPLGGSGIMATVPIRRSTPDAV